MTWWYNNATAHYYGKNTVQCVYSPIYGNDERKVFRIWPGLFECDLDYVTIYKIDGNTGDVEYVQELEPLDRNLVIDTYDKDNVTLVIDVYGDSLGDEKIDELELEW
jgi:hypothetical protein